MTHRTKNRLAECDAAFAHRTLGRILRKHMQSLENKDVRKWHAAKRKTVVSTIGEKIYTALIMTVTREA